MPPCWDSAASLMKLIVLAIDSQPIIGPITIGVQLRDAYQVLRVLGGSGCRIARHNDSNGIDQFARVMTEKGAGNRGA